MTQHTKQKPIQPEDEIGLVDIIQFLRRNIKFLGLTTLVLSALAISLSLLQPKQYQKQLTLSVKSTSIPLSAQPHPVGQLIDVNQTGALAVEFLKAIPLDRTTVAARYDLDTQKIDLNLHSPNPNSLRTASPEIVSQLKKKFQEPLSQTLDTSLMVTELELKKHQKILPQLEQKIAQLPPTNTAQLEGLETERAKTVAEIAALEFDKDYLEQSQKNLDDFVGKIIFVQILSESEVQQVRSLVQLVVIAVTGSFMVAVVVTIIRDRVMRYKDGLNQLRINDSADV